MYPLMPNGHDSDNLTRCYLHDLQATSPITKTKQISILTLDTLALTFCERHARTVAAAHGPLASTVLKYLDPWFSDLPILRELEIHPGGHQFG